MTRHLCLALIVLLLAAAGGPAAEPGEGDAAKDLARLQGKWKLVETDVYGTATRSDDGHVIGFEKELMIGYDADGKVATKDSVKLDPSGSPRAIDLTCVLNVLYPINKGNTLQAIYRLEGNELKMAFPVLPFRQRPKAFTTRKWSTFVVFTYKRVKP
jgi:uncharacterized protein (TIGR03067 family)